MILLLYYVLDSSVDVLGPLMDVLQVGSFHVGFEFHTVGSLMDVFTILLLAFVIEHLRWSEKGKYLKESGLIF